LRLGRAGQLARLLHLRDEKFYENFDSARFGAVVCGITVEDEYLYEEKVGFQGL
jgi:hypothetical protein